jgi:hypothetical protein
VVFLKRAGRVLERVDEKFLSPAGATVGKVDALIVESRGITAVRTLDVLQDRVELVGRSVVVTFRGDRGAERGEAGRLGEALV